MGILVRIPTSMLHLTNGRIELESAGSSVGELVDALEEMYPGIKANIYCAPGQVRKFINIYVNQEDIRTLDSDATTLHEQDEVDIIVAIPGG